MTYEEWDRLATAFAEDIVDYTKQKHAASDARAIRELFEVMAVLYPMTPTNREHLQETSVFLRDLEERYGKA